MNENPGRILLVEDEPHLAFTLQLNLKSEGYVVEHATNGKDAIDFFKQKGPFDLVILDVMIPEPNGFDVARTIRSGDEKIAIIMLTARASDSDRIQGLELGVDDYMSKPFSLKELLLKVRRAIQRVDMFEGSEGLIGKKAPETFSCGPYVLDTQALELVTPNGKFSVTALEADVLREFMRNQNRVLTREHLLTSVWGMNKNIETRTVDNFVMRLRKYLEKDPTKPEVLESVRGRGYRFKI